jgi:hypothetical protein
MNEYLGQLRQEVVRAAWLGARIGIRLALLYTSAWLLFATWKAISGSSVSELPYALLIWGLVVLLICVIGATASLFAAVIGWMTAALLAVILYLIGSRLKAAGAALLGTVLCLGITYPLNRPFWPLSNTGIGAEVSYWYVGGLGIPSLIYVIAGGVVSLRLQRMIARMYTRPIEDSSVDAALHHRG